MLHVFAVFDVHTGELTAIAASVVGAGAAAIQHTGRPLATEDGIIMTIDGLEAGMALRAETLLLDHETGEERVRIERRALAA